MGTIGSKSMVLQNACLKISKKKYKEIIERKTTFVCGRKCFNSILPFHHSDDIDLFSALYGSGEFPCGSCHRDCLEYSACIQCSICDMWHHFECSNLTVKEFYNNPYFFCSDRCEICLLPFTEVDTTSLVKSGILAKSATKPPKKTKKKPKKKKTRMDFKNADFVKFDHFLEINCDYLDPNHINEHFFKDEDANLTIFQNNIRSQNKNFHKVREIFNECKCWPDILAFTETKLNENSCIPVLPGFSFEHINSPTACGGVGVFLSDRLHYSVRHDLSLNIPGVEDIWVELEIDSVNHEKSTAKNVNKFVIGTIYRHPITSNYDRFCNSLCESVEKLNDAKTKYALLGDMNIDILKYNLVTNVTNFINSVNSVGCSFHIDKATRVTQNSASCIDHVYSNLPPNRLENRILMSDVSDHFGILTKINKTPKMFHEHPLFFRRSKLTDQEWEQFNKELKLNLDKDLSTYMNNTDCDVNLFAESITSIYHDLIEKYMPIRTFSRKQKRFFHKPWISKGIKVSIRTKNNLFKKSKTTNAPGDAEKYKIYRTILTRIKLRAKHNYYSELAFRYGNTKSKMWQLVNEISNRKRKVNKGIRAIKNKNGKKID